ncbi:MAG: hypothetical protein DRJ52_11430 [Thermoprotei archaeon]|nr:MAG: hypothetical protein DRJ52_11430 [Thermoprotei archaeon]
MKRGAKFSGKIALHIGGDPVVRARLEDGKFFAAGEGVYVTIEEGGSTAPFKKYDYFEAKGLSTLYTTSYSATLRETITLWILSLKVN